MARSTTRKSALKAKSALHEADDDDFFPDDRDEEPDDDDACYAQGEPKAKRQSRGGAVRRGSRGSKGALRGILDLPLDILALVCSELDLPTLFHLSRLNKRFYSFLRNNSSLAFIWERAREASGLPELTAPGMDTVQYAHLLFGRFCQGCGKATTKVDYILRVRYCKACSEEFIWDGRDWDMNYCHNPDSCPDLRFFGGAEAKFRVNPQVVLNVDKDDMAFVEVGQYSNSEFFDRCSAVRCARVKDGVQMINWQQERDNEKEVERQAVRERRREAIEARFEQLGWQPHHFDSDEWRMHSHVNVAKEFSDTVWKSVRIPLQAFLHKIAAARDAQHIADESERRLDARESEYDELHNDKDRLKALGLYPLPRWVEFSALESVKSLWAVPTIEDAYSDAVSTIQSDAGFIASALASVKAVFSETMFPKLVEALRDVEAKHASSGPSTTPMRLLPDPEDDGDFSEPQRLHILAYACSALQCHLCNFVDVFPRLLAHRCSTYHTTKNAATSFDPRHYRVSRVSVEAILYMLDAARLPEDSHYTALDDLGPTLSCLCGGLIAVPWHNLADHLVTWKVAHKKLVIESKEAARERVFQGACHQTTPYLWRRTEEGFIAGLLELPVELVLRICIHLDLATLFALSRLSKQFYRVLRAPSATAVWESVRDRDGLPKLSASGLDVYALANLLFGCCQVDRFPRLFAHRCLDAGKTECAASFRAQLYKCSPEHIRAAVSVLRAAGKDLRVPTAEMDALGRTFSCECVPQTTNACGLDWMAMVQHRAQGIHSVSLPWERAMIIEGIDVEFDWDAPILFETPELVKDRIFRPQQDMYASKRRGRDVWMSVVS
ncbi:hypothetical protein JCM3770_003685 [Rhodotorula araucariae]